MRKLDEYIDKAQHLPPAPRILPQLMQLLNRSDVGSREVVDLIIYDPALTVSVIRTANSAYLAARCRSATFTRPSPA
jgi:HD-like signal output (HDOD) protein